MRTGKGNQEIQPLVVQLAEYTKFHFRSEEQRMLKAHYPEYAEHHAAHERFKARVQEYQERVKQNQVNLGMSVEVANFLKDWLLNHILKEDRKYTPYLEERISQGVSGSRI